MASEKKMRKISRKLHWGRSSCFLKASGKGIKRVSFYTPSDRMNDKAGAVHEYESEMDDDVDYDFLLNKYGPEGLWLIADKMKEVALKDVHDGIEQSLTLDIACYDNVIKIKENEQRNNN